MPVFNADLIQVNASYFLFLWMVNVDTGLRYLTVTELAVVSTLCIKCFAEVLYERLSFGRRKFSSQDVRSLPFSRNNYLKKRLKF